MMESEFTDDIRKFAEPPQDMIIMHDCIVS